MPAGENVYTLKLLNMNARLHRYDLHPEGIPGLDLSTDGPIEAEVASVVEIPVRPMAEEPRPESRSTPVTFVLIAADDDRLSVREEARFYPVSPRRWAALRPTSGPGRQAQICRCLPSFAAAPPHRAMTHHRPFNIVTT